MATMPAQQPGIVQGEDHGQAAAKFRQNTQIEVVAVEIVAVEDIGGVSRQLQELAAAGKIEILTSQEVIAAMRNSVPSGAATV